MKKFFSLGILLMLFSFITSSLYASTPLVDAVWVKDQIGKEGVVMLDLRTPASYKKRTCARFGLYQLQQR